MWTTGDLIDFKDIKLKRVDINPDILEKVSVKLDKTNIKKIEKKIKEQVEKFDKHMQGLDLIQSYLDYFSNPQVFTKKC